MRIVINIRVKPLKCQHNTLIEGIYKAPGDREKKLDTKLFELIFPLCDESAKSFDILIFFFH